MKTTDMTPSVGTTAHLLAATGGAFQGRTAPGYRPRALAQGRTAPVAGLPVPAGILRDATPIPRGTSMI